MFMSNKFDEVKDKVLISNCVNGSIKFSSKRIRVNPCPLCGGHDCFDVIPSGVKGNVHEIFKCQQCGESGSIIDFYCLTNNLNPKDKTDVSKAINELCNIHGIDNTNTNEVLQKPSDSSVSTIQDNVSNVNKQIEKKVYDFTEVADKLHNQLLQSEEGMKYFKDRGLSEDTIKKFKLGYDPKGINEALQDYPELHLYKEVAECYPYFIPTFNDEGVCEYILPRQAKHLLEDKFDKGLLNKVDRDGKERKYAKTMNLKSVPTTIYNLDNAIKDNYIFITEGWCDALSIENLGYSAIALNSVSSVNLFLKQLKEYKDYQSKYYIIALDNDVAGAKARGELEKQLIDLKCKVKHLYVTGEGVKDINDMLLVGADKLDNAICNIFVDIEREKEDLLTKNSCYSYLQSTLNKFISNKDKQLLSTGYDKLDKALGGGLYNSLYVIGGISGLGKTSIVLNIIENIAKADNDVMFISLEMSRDELIAKSLSRFIRDTVDKRFSPMDYPSQRDIQDGKFDLADKSVKEGIEKYSAASKNIFIQEANFNYNTEIIREDIINHKMLRGKAPVLVVDYLQVLPCLKDYMDDKKNIDFNITELKRISREYDIPVIVISSIGRQYYKKQIDFEAFKSSGNIEFTADVVIGLQYSFMDGIGNMKDNDIVDMYKEAKIKYPREVQTVILKNRNGSIGETTDFIYEPRYNYFNEV